MSRRKAGRMGRKCPRCGSGKTGGGGGWHYCSSCGWSDKPKEKKTEPKKEEKEKDESVTVGTVAFLHKGR